MPYLSSLFSYYSFSLLAYITVAAPDIFVCTKAVVRWMSLFFLWCVSLVPDIFPRFYIIDRTMTFELWDWELSFTIVFVLYELLENFIKALNLKILSTFYGVLIKLRHLQFHGYLVNAWIKLLICSTVLGLQWLRCINIGILRLTMRFPRVGWMSETVRRKRISIWGSWGWVRLWLEGYLEGRV